MLPSRQLSVVLLGDRQARTSALLDRAEARLSRAVTVHRWDAGSVTRRAMLSGLGSGVDVAIYTGHGTPSGWPTYGGVRPSDLVREGAQPIGTLVCLTCHGATRRPDGGSFSDDVVATGVACAVLAAEGEVSHETNDAVLASITSVLVNGAAATVGELLSAVAAAVPASPYVITGDPDTAVPG